MSLKRLVLAVMLALALVAREAEPILIKALCEPSLNSYRVDHAE